MLEALQTKRLFDKDGTTHEDARTIGLKTVCVPSGGKLPVDGAEGLLQYGRVGEEGVIVL